MFCVCDLFLFLQEDVVRTVAAPHLIVVKCRGLVLRVVVCGVVVVSCVVVFLSCRVLCCSCRVFVRVTCFFSYGRRNRLQVLRVVVCGVDLVVCWCVWPVSLLAPSPRHLRSLSSEGGVLRLVLVVLFLSCVCVCDFSSFSSL